MPRGERVGVAAEHRAPAPLEPAEEARVADEPVFGDLGVARPQLAQRQGREHVGIGDDERRLVERADQVLALRRVDAGLAADRAVDLGEQGRRHLHEADAAAQDRSGEAREIADHAAAERDDEIAALQAHPQQPLAQRAELAEALGRLAGRQHDRAGQPVLRPEACLEHRKMQARHVLVRDDAAPRLGEAGRDQPAGGGEQPRPDEYVVGAGAERHVHAAAGALDGEERVDDGRHQGTGAVVVVHGLSAFVTVWPLSYQSARGATSAGDTASASTISVTMISCGTSRLSTMTSESR